jgi:hypothetical protein
MISKKSHTKGALLQKTAPFYPQSITRSFMAPLQPSPQL